MLAKERDASYTWATKRFGIKEKGDEYSILFFLMLFGWAAIHQEELRENWNLARQKQELFTIDPLR